MSLHPSIIAPMDMLVSERVDVMADRGDETKYSEVNL
jgi:hypothetical protein